MVCCRIAYEYIIVFKTDIIEIGRSDPTVVSACCVTTNSESGRHDKQNTKS